MYSQIDLDEAVGSGAITADAAASLRAFVDGQRGLSNIDDENFRLLTGFNDIFVNIATIIMLVAVGWLGALVYGPLAGAAVAAVAWGLALFFTEKRRMALPSITLLIAFVGGAAVTAGRLLDDGGSPNSLTIAASGLVGAAAAWVHWRKFHVPITIAAGAAAGAVILFGLVGSSVGRDLGSTPSLLTALVSGLAIFVLAMWWDSSDPARVTRRSDVAFWLHLLASPMIVHPVFALLGLNNGGGGTGGALVIVALYALLGIIALAIDRRALLVSALLYVLWALGQLIGEFGKSGLNIALTALVIGSALLLLSAFWHQARRWIVAQLPEGLRSHLPPVDRVSPPPVA
ncbi:MAG: hypothetical protein ABIR77_08275 [Sphingomicrobium sp.]